MSPPHDLEKGNLIIIEPNDVNSFFPPCLYGASRCSSRTFFREKVIKKRTLPFFFFFFFRECYFFFLFHLIFTTFELNVPGPAACSLKAIAAARICKIQGFLYVIQPQSQQQPRKVLHNNNNHHHHHHYKKKQKMLLFSYLFRPVFHVCQSRAPL